MTTPPARPKVYHITHMDNLPSIVADGELLSDAAVIAKGGPAQPIGMSGIKRRRVEELEVDCYPGTKVGDYVPFYFCPRSVMLYVIHCANHVELTYRGGQDPIVHLEADVQQVVSWANANQVRWAFSLSNAGARYTEFRSNLESLAELDWNAIAAQIAAERGNSESANACLFAELNIELPDHIGHRLLSPRPLMRSALWLVRLGELRSVARVIERLE